LRAVVLGDLGGIQEAFSLTSITGRMQGPEIQLRSSNGRGGPMRGKTGFYKNEPKAGKKNVTVKFV